MDPRIALPLLFLPCFFTVSLSAQSNETTAAAAPDQEARVGWVVAPNQRGTLTLHEKPWQKALRKAKWMAITILFPEFIFSKAVCELRMAVANLRDMHEAMRKARVKLRWKDSADISGVDRVILTWTWRVDFGKGMRWLHWFCGLGKLPTIIDDQEESEEATTENEEKSGHEEESDNQGESENSEPVAGNSEVEGPAEQPQPDNITKYSSIVWLILNVWTRAIARVPVTQLKIATVAFSLTAIVTYAANWWKPKDIDKPTILSRLPYSWATPKDYSSFQSFVSRILKPSDTRDMKFEWEWDRIPNDTTWMKGEPPMPRMLSALMAVSSMIFGGFHCLAWNVQFPSKTEQGLWRAASITSALLPGVSLAITSAVNILATTTSENWYLTSVHDILAPLHRLSEAYWRVLRQKPKCLDWPWQFWFVFHTRLSQQLSDTLDWEEQPTVTGELPPDAKETAGKDRSALEASWSNLGYFRESWSEVNNGIITRQYAHPLFLLRYDYILGEDTNGGSRNVELSAKQLRAYEAYLKTKPPDLAPDLRDFCVRDFLVNNRQPIEALKSRRKAFEKNCNRASRFVTISSSIVYAASRLVIMVLLFTSLRSVPEGVYENSPWTRFLPNIS
ncbi:hypothetical protein C8A03DRAFT_39029 [Achaetomium macrosporum]|uniref:Uncharacterized protein n=1 Tax=Achaetomium macrosporum TaxID=79813 RepID=A0AAN7C0W5_9PEZI|nr:hypothetical protein C8A03DRAFT_39029 [Achaetomium macrosporum]